MTPLLFAENLSDRRAADAVRSRIDWEYLLGLELTDPGFDASVLSEFRDRLVAGAAEEHLLDTLLTLCRDLKLAMLRPRDLRPFVWCDSGSARTVSTPTADGCFAL